MVNQQKSISFPYSIIQKYVNIWCVFFACPSSAAFSGLPSIFRANPQGLVTVPFWEYWTSPEKVAMALTIYLMVGWCSMRTFNDPWSRHPNSVTKKVCSNCADLFPSRVTAVQLSGQVLAPENNEKLESKIGKPYILYIYICYDTNTIYKYTNCNTLFQYILIFLIYNYYLTITIITIITIIMSGHFCISPLSTKLDPISTVSTQVDHGFHSENLTTTTSTRATRDPGDDALSCTELRTWPGFMIPTALFFLERFFYKAMLLEQKTYN